MDIKELLNEYESLEINADELKKEIDAAKAEKVKFADGHKKYWKEIKGKKLGESLNEGYKNFQRTLDDYDGSVMTITANNGYWVIAEISGCEGKTDKELDELADEVLTEKGLIKGDYFTAKTDEEADKNIVENYTGIETPADYKERYKIGCKYLASVADVEPEYYEIVEDNYEYPFGLTLIEYADLEHEEEIEHTCIDLYGKDYPFGMLDESVNEDYTELQNDKSLDKYRAILNDDGRVDSYVFLDKKHVEVRFTNVYFKDRKQVILLDDKFEERLNKANDKCRKVNESKELNEVNESVNEAKLDWQYVGDDSLKSKIDWLYHHNVNYNKKQYYAIDDIRDYLKGIKELSDEDIEDLIFLLQHNNKNYRGDQETIINELELNAIKKAVNESVNEAEKKYLTKAELVAKIKEGILPDEYEPSDIGQGMGYKIDLRWDEIPSDDIVIYIPEYGYGMWDDQDSMPKEDSIYTKADFREITKELGKRAEEEAEYLFQAVDWQHPESLWDEMDVDDEMDESISLAKRTLTKFSGIREDYDASTFQFCIRGGDIKLLDRLIDEKIAEYDKADKAGRHEIALAVEDMLRRLASSGENELPNAEFNRLYDKLAALDDRIIEDNTAEMKKAEKEVRAELIKNESSEEARTALVKGREEELKNAELASKKAIQAEIAAQFNGTDEEKEQAKENTANALKAEKEANNKYKKTMDLLQKRAVRKLNQSLEKTESVNEDLSGIVKNLNHYYGKDAVDAFIGDIISFKPEFYAEGTTGTILSTLYDDKGDIKGFKVKFDDGKEEDVELKAVSGLIKDHYEDAYIKEEKIDEFSPETIEKVSIERKRNSNKAHDEFRHKDDEITAEKMDIFRKNIYYPDSVKEIEEKDKQNGWTNTLKELSKKATEADKKLERNTELVAKRNARLNKTEKDESLEEEKREVLPIKFIGVDEWNRPAFKPVNKEKKYFLTDINNLFSEGATEEEVKKFYADAVEKGTALRDLITYHGYSLDDDPMGSKLKFDLEIV